MFYLKHFIEHILKHPIVVICYSISLLLFIGSISLQVEIEKHIHSFFPDREQGAYFHALISEKENVSRIRRKVAKLPGVKSVALLDQSKVMSQVKQTMKAFDLDEETITNLSVKGLKVTFDIDATKRTKALTRKYLMSQGTEDDITVGTIKEVTVKKKVNLFESIVKKWGALSISGISVILWIVFTFTLSNQLKKRAYIITQFQRRSRVAFKIMLTGTSLLAVIFASLLLLVKGVDHLTLGVTAAAVILSNILFVRELKWQK